jgi:glycosyltransferase involved in cell wall biosynthesis
MLGQTYQHYEYIIIDNVSKDKTLDIVKRYEKSFNRRLKWISEPDKGIFDAMNKGINLARGSLIGTLNSDDFYSAKSLELAAEAYVNNISRNRLFVIIGNLIKIDIDKKPLYVLKPNKFEIIEKIDSSFHIIQPVSFVIRDVYKKVGKFDISFKYAADYDFFYRAFKLHKIDIIELDAVLTYMRSGGATDKLINVFHRTKEEFIVRKDRQSLFKNLFISAHYFIIVFLKIFIKKLFGDRILQNYYRKKENLPLIIKKIAKI